MQNKKRYFIVVAGVLVVGAAAFLAGRLINNGINPLGLLGPADDGISFLPAEELPKTPPEVEGLFIERQDNIIIIQGGGPNVDNPDGVEVGSPEHLSGGPKAEVVVTTETILYHDTTEPPARRPSTGRRGPRRTPSPGSVARRRARSWPRPELPGRRSSSPPRRG